MAVLNCWRAEHTANSSDYRFMLKCSLSLLLCSLSLFFELDPALKFPGWTQLSVRTSLHLSGAAEPGLHHPTCQSQPYTFNPLHLSEADLTTAPPSPLPFSKQSPPQERWDPSHSPTSTSSQTLSYKHAPADELSQSRQAAGGHAWPD